MLEKDKESKDKKVKEVKSDKLKLLKKLAKLQSDVEGYLKKEAFNSGQKFYYNPSSQVLNEIRDKIIENNLLLFMNVKEANVEKFERNFLTTMFYDMVWVDVDTGESITVPWYAQGIDMAEKGVGKCYSYAEKFFLLKFLHISSDKYDDPDAVEELPKATQKVSYVANNPSPSQPPKVPQPFNAVYDYDTYTMPFKNCRGQLLKTFRDVGFLKYIVTGCTNPSQKALFEIRLKELGAFE